MVKGPGRKRYALPVSIGSGSKVGSSHRLFLAVNSTRLHPYSDWAPLSPFPTLSPRSPLLMDPGTSSAANMAALAPPPPLPTATRRPACGFLPHLSVILLFLPLFSISSPFPTTRRPACGFLPHLSVILLFLPLFSISSPFPTASCQCRVPAAWPSLVAPLPPRSFRRQSPPPWRAGDRYRFVLRG